MKLKIKIYRILQLSTKFLLSNKIKKIRNSFRTHKKWEYWLQHITPLIPFSFIPFSMTTRGLRLYNNWTGDWSSLGTAAVDVIYLAASRINESRRQQIRAEQRFSSVVSFQHEHEAIKDLMIRMEHSAAQVRLSFSLCNLLNVGMVRKKNGDVSSSTSFLLFKI